MSTPCPCESGHALDLCCGPALEGLTLPSNAEALMRSRYTAYVNRDASYLLTSWHPQTRPPHIEFDPNQNWLGLRIKDVRHGAVESEVEFVARFKTDGRGHRLHERSRFVFEDDRWYYIDGEIQDSTR